MRDLVRQPNDPLVKLLQYSTTLESSRLNKKVKKSLMKISEALLKLSYLAVGKDKCTKTLMLINKF